MDFFENIDEPAQQARPRKPIWVYDLKQTEDKRILDWLNGELGYLIEKNRDRLALISRNEYLYRGVQYETQEIRRDLQDRSVDKTRSVPKIVVNHLYDLTTNRVGRLVKYKPAVAILPSNNEHQDKVAAKITKALLDNIWYELDFDGKVTPEVGLTTSVKGETYLWIDWDPNAGDLHPDSPKDGAEVTLMGENGEPLKNEDGTPIKVKEEVHVGDVAYEVTPPERVFLQPQIRIQDVEYCFRATVYSCEDAKLKFPKAAHKIKPNVDKYRDYPVAKRQDLIEPVLIWEFWHKKTKALKDGALIYFTDTAILSSSKHKFNHGDLPFERFTDIDEPGVLHGMSFFETVKALTATYNNLTNMIVRNQYLVAHPKWMMPAGSAKIESLGNDITVVQFKGPQAPQLIQASPTSPEVFNFRGQLKEDFQQLSGVFGVSRGEPPPGIKAGVALQFLSEQEAERANLQILKWNDFIKCVAIKTLAVAGDYYDTTDNRMVRILGKNNKWMTKFFDASYLTKQYDIRVQNSSALPQSKAARVQTIMDLNQQFPELLPKEQIIELLDLGQSDEYIDQVTSAVRTAEAENEAILNGDKTAGVKEYENHLLHWQIHAKAVQDYSFKEETPEEQRQAMIDHIMVHEMFLVKKGKTNQALAQKLAALDTFPMFFVDMATMPPPSPEEEMAGGAPAGAFQDAPPMPSNQEVAGAPTELPDAPPVEEQTQQPLEPEPGPVEPTGAI